MSDNKFLSAMGNIDEKYYMDSIPSKYEEEKRKVRFKFANVAAAVLALFLLGGTSVYAYYMVTNRTEVNQEELPAIDEMSCVESFDFSNVDENIIYDDYRGFNDLAGLNLLDSSLSEPNPYMQVRVETDKKDFAIIRVENYILGDTSNYQLVEDINLYNCDPGEVYYSSISLEADLILSQEQLETGFDMEYLGCYEYVESYVAEDGTKVNMVQGTFGNEEDGVVSEKIAIFVKNGVKYTLSGRVSIEEMKHIVDTMQ